MIYELTIESRLNFDDSEYSKEFLGFFATFDIETLVNKLLNEYWEMNGEDVLNNKIIEQIKNIINTGEESFEILEDDSTVNWESCRRVFTVSISEVKEESTNFYQRGFGSNIANTIFGEDLEKNKKHLVAKIKEAIESLEKIEKVSYIDIVDNNITVEVTYNNE